MKECLQIFLLGLNVLFLFSVLVKVLNFDSISEKKDGQNTLQDLFIYSRLSLKWLSNLIISTSNKYNRRNIENMLHVVLTYSTLSIGRMKLKK